MLIFYILGLDVLHDHISLYFLRVIYAYHFCLYLAFFFYLLCSLIFCFLNHVVSPIRLRLNVTQEVPLPPYLFIITLATLRAMLILVVGRRVKEGSFVNKLSYIVNLILFGLILNLLLNFKSFYSTIHDY